MSKSYEVLVEEIKKTYEVGVSLDEAERLAALALLAADELNRDLRGCDLDVRMRKSGLKAIKATVRSNEISKHDRKPSEGVLEDVVALDPTTREEQDAFDRAEAHKNYLENNLSVANNGHIYYRGIAKGRID